MNEQITETVEKFRTGHLSINEARQLLSLKLLSETETKAGNLYNNLLCDIQDALIGATEPIKRRKIK